MTDTAEDSGTSYKPLATFDGYLKKWDGNMQDNTLQITLAVNEDSKYEAMPLTDHPGRSFRFTVEMLTFDGFDDAE